MDLNSDLGESFGRWVLGDDDAMLGLVTSANVACGFHAGDPSTLRSTCAAAAGRGVVVGAQVGYRDLPGFGRRFIDVPPADLAADVLYQLGALEAMCRVAGTAVRYVKPHGALYNTAVHHAGRRGPWSTRSATTTRRCRCSACPGRSCCGPPRRPGCRPCGSSSSTAATPRRARWCRAVSPAPSSTTRTRSPSGCCAWSPPAR